MAEDLAGALKECDTVEKFNAFALALARERRARNPEDGFAKAVAAEAKRRKYTYIGDRETGCYTAITPEEHAAILDELKRLDRMRDLKFYMQRARKTKINSVFAMWQQTDPQNRVGRVFILDIRERQNNKYTYFFSDVPLNLFDQLFSPSAKLALKDIFNLCESLLRRPEEINMLEAG